MRKTKIVATIGPASASREVIQAFIKEGVNVCRLNFSHGKATDHLQAIELIRSIDMELGTYTSILADLQGPKLRVGDMANGPVKLAPHAELIITNVETKGTAEKIFTNYKNFPKDVKPGELVLLDDGKLQLEVISSDSQHEVMTRVVHGGLLHPQKGINLPNTRLSLPSLTEKDLADLETALAADVDWVALSFVRNADDIIELKKLIKEKGGRARVVAKIEKPEALESIDEIIEASDGVMVARGDLGVEVPMEKVPLIQKHVIQKCLENAKPVIVATQMMESMISNAVPTRAEVNDVANAVLDHADAVMLSAETSVGEYPVEVVKAMGKILTEMETDDSMYNIGDYEVQEDERMISDSICFTSVRLSGRVGAKGIVTMTHSGYTAFKIASYRPPANIFAFTSNRKILSMLSLVWGVQGFYYDKMVSTDHTIADIKHILRDKGAVGEGDLIINIASMPIAEKGMSNMMKLSYV